MFDSVRLVCYITRTGDHSWAWSSYRSVVMDLEIDLDFLDPVAEGVIRGRDLQEDDVKSTVTPAQPPVEGRSRRIRERHHTLALAVAEGAGKTDKQIALEHGYSPATLYRLRNDQVFMELVDHFRAGMDAAQADAFQRMTDLCADAIDEIDQRLDEKPGDFTTNQLMKLVELTADRTGFGPQTKSELNVNIGLGDKLSAARKRVEANLIDITPNKE